MPACQQIARQDAIWRTLLETPDAWARHAGVDVQLYAGRAPRADLLDVGLASDSGLFQRVLPSGNAKVGAVAYLDGVPVAHALLMNRANMPPAMPNLGMPLGLIGVYTRPDLRGRGLARACLGALDDRLTAPLAARARKQTRAAPVWLVAEPRMLALARTAMRLPVCARPGTDDTLDAAAADRMRRDAWRHLLAA